MIQPQPFPFWTSDKAITYTDLQEFCRVKYRVEGADLIDKCKHSLEVYCQMSDRRAALDVMLALDKYSLELSALNSIWTDFSVAVFEVIILSARSSIKRTSEYLTDMFNSTIRRLQDGHTITSN